LRPDRLPTVQFSGNAAYWRRLRWGDSRVLRAELRGTGVRTSLISPAATDTDIWNDVTVTTRR
jgi:hypothetical protein